MCYILVIHRNLFYLINLISRYIEDKIRSKGRRSSYLKKKSHKQEDEGLEGSLQQSNRSSFREKLSFFPIYLF